MSASHISALGNMAASQIANQFINIFGYLFARQLVIYLSGCQLASMPAAHSACQHVSLPISLSAWLFT
jgi:hypothetical protein